MSAKKGMNRQTDETLNDEPCSALCNDVQNCRFAYLQSDEINLLLYAN